VVIEQMTYSTRDLLALISLVALGLLPWRIWTKTRQEKARVAQLQSEVSSLEAIVRLDHPTLHQAILHTQDEFRPLGAMRERSLEQFDVLRQKYSTLEPHGVDVLSIRGIPSLSTDSESAPIIFRLYVPVERPVWFMFGVHSAQQSVNTSRSPDDEHQFVSVSPFTVSGPLEMQLPPGDQTLKIITGAAQNGSLPLLLSLNERVLLRSSFVAAGISGFSSSHISVPFQLDFGPNQKLPWLLTANMHVPEPEKQEAFAFSLWLSDHASNFRKFPDDDPEQPVPTDARR
jgi:hypothetical protein